jgi:phospholipase/carboxylesterase
MSSKLSTIEIQPSSEHLYSIIWLHGLGADGHDFEGIVPELQLRTVQHIHFIFPNAPKQLVTINGGMEMRAWYDILEMSIDHKVDIDGIYHSAAQIEALLENEINHGIAAENIILAGFSQGGVIALHTGLSYKRRLAGIIALSTYLPTVEQLQTERSVANLCTPLLMAHGIMDPVVAIELGRQARNSLTAMEYNIEWHEYPMEHTICLEEIKHISAFINRNLIYTDHISYSGIDKAFQ